MTGVQFVTDAKGRKVAVQLDLIDLCTTNRHMNQRKAGRSEAVTNERISRGRRRTFLARRHSVERSSSWLSGRPLARAALKWVRTNSSGLSSGA